MNLNDFIQIGINMDSASKDGAIGFSRNMEGVLEIHIFSDFFKEYAGSHSVVMSDRRDEKYPIQLYFEYNGCKFFTIMDEQEFNADFKEWFEEFEVESVDTTVESRPRGVTWQEEARKEAGMKEGDFQ